MKVHVLTHVHQTAQEVEDEKLIGVYSSKLEAEKAIERLCEQPGFKTSADGFCIDEYELDKDQWREGFTTVD